MKANIREDITSISRMLFNRVTSPYKQHGIIKFIGDTGTGKSYALMGILEDTSIMMEDYFGGSREDYFNIDNIAIITFDEVQRVVKKFKKHGLYDFDDIGVAANARRAMSDDNILLNDIVSTFRPNQNVLGMSVPKNRMIDVVQRELAHYNIEMSDPFFMKGFSTGTLYIPEETQYGYVNTYPIWNGKIYKRHIFHLPSKRLIEEYDEKRAIISKELELDNASMFGLKAKTKKAKTLIAAQKAGVRITNPLLLKHIDENTNNKIEKRNNNNENKTKHKITRNHPKMILEDIIKIERN